ncbi:hypothetical protein D3C86_938610 [compost metagenome]
MTDLSSFLNSFTDKPPGTLLSSVRITQCGCQIIPSLSNIPSAFSSQIGVSSKSGCEVNAKATMPSVLLNPTSVGFNVVGKTYPRTGAPFSCPAFLGVVAPAWPATFISQIVTPNFLSCLTEADLILKSSLL